MKKFPKGIVWINESSIYVARKSSYKNERVFLKAVIRHIRYVKEHYHEAECGWFEVPKFKEFIGTVTTGLMAWEKPEDESGWYLESLDLIQTTGPGGVKVWLVDFEVSAKDIVMRRLLGKKSGTKYGEVFS